MKVGILANEFLDPAGGRIGGFGWAARESATLLADRGDEVVLLTGELDEEAVGPHPQVHGLPLVPVRRSPLRHAAELRRHRPDVVLGIDFRPNYRPVLRALPDVPLIVWARDPRTPADDARLATLRLPDGERPPEGLLAPDCTELGRIVARGRRRVVIASLAPGLLGDRARGAYALPCGTTVELLPNPVDLGAPRVPRARDPLVVVLGRLDPYKRPWIAVEVARRLPRVRFRFLGRRHFTGPGSWEPRNLPPNVELAGNVGGSAKHAALGEAWALLNTSLHEGIPVTFFEAMTAATPIVSGLDPDGVVSRAGIPVGATDGHGLEAVPAYVAALERLLADEDARRRLGAAGRAWVTAHHGPDRFLAAFDGLVAALGPPGLLRRRRHAA